MPIRICDASELCAASTPGVSAHLNVSRVFQFYNDVLIGAAWTTRLVSRQHGQLHLARRRDSTDMG